MTQRLVRQGLLFVAISGLGWLLDVTVFTSLQAAAQQYGWVVRPAGIRLLAKIIVTPATLLLNFLVVRFLVERFVGVRRPAALTRNERTV